MGSHGRAERALRSPWLAEAYEGYWAAFAEERKHFYSGLNALALAAILLELGERLPAMWLTLYEKDDKATEAHDTLKTHRSQLQAAVELSRQSAQRLVDFTGRPDKYRGRRVLTAARDA